MPKTERIAVSLDRPVAPDPYDLLPMVGSFTVTSPDVTDGRTVDREFVYGPDDPGGQNRSPALAWSGFPDGTRSFVVNCFDPDAPTPSGFWHWTLVDIPVEVTELACRSGELGGGDPGRRVPRRQRLRHRRLRRAGPAAGRSGAPVLLRRARGRRPDSRGGSVGGPDGRCLQPGFPHAGAGADRSGLLLLTGG